MTQTIFADHGLKLDIDQEYLYATVGKCTRYYRRIDNYTIPRITKIFYSNTNSLWLRCVFEDCNGNAGNFAEFFCVVNGELNGTVTIPNLNCIVMTPKGEIIHPERLQIHAAEKYRALLSLERCVGCDGKKCFGEPIEQLCNVSDVFPLPPEGLQLENAFVTSETPCNICVIDICDPQRLCFGKKFYTGPKFPRTGKTLKILLSFWCDKIQGICAFSACNHIAKMGHKSCPHHTCEIAGCHRSKGANTWGLKRWCEYHYWFPPNIPLKKCEQVCIDITTCQPNALVFSACT